MRKLSKGEPYRGYVSGILSGDSLIVRFVSGDIPPIQIVSLEHLIAPKFGSLDGQISDEPHGYDSWEFMRNLCIGKRVLVTPPQNKTDLTRTHQSFGRLPVFFSRIILCDQGNEDVGLTCVQNGWVRIRAPRNRDNYINSLFAGEASAKASKLGIWSCAGTIRQLPAPINPDALLEIGEFDCTVENVANGSTFMLFLLPYHEYIRFQVAGCRAPPAKKEEAVEFGQEARTFSLHRLLHRKLRIRIISMTDSSLFCGTILDRNDRQIRCLLLDGLARYSPYPDEIFHVPSRHEYQRCEDEARACRRNIWAHEIPYESPFKQFEGYVQEILGTASILVNTDHDLRVVQFNNVATPPYIPGGGSEPFGFECRERLRDLLLGQLVTVLVDGAIDTRFFCTVFVGTENGVICVNEVLAAEGYCHVSKPLAGVESERIDSIRKAEAEAKRSHIGVHAATQADPFYVTDISWHTTNEQSKQLIKSWRGCQFSGIIESVIGGSRFAVLMPGDRLMLRVVVNGIYPLPANDRLAPEVREYCEERFLQRNCVFTVIDIDRNGGFLSNVIVDDEDVAFSLLSEGYAELHQMTAKTLTNFDELYQVQEDARRQGLGKWGDKTRIPIPLEYGVFYRVQIVAMYDLCCFTVQLVSDLMPQINSILHRANTPVDRKLMRNDLVVVSYFGRKYRGHVENADDNVRVHLIDDDVTVNVNWDHVFEIPSELANVRPQCFPVRLAFLYMNDCSTDECSAIWNLVRGKILHMQLVYEDQGDRCVVFFERPVLDSGTLNNYVLCKYPGSVIIEPQTG